MQFKTKTQYQEYIVHQCPLNTYFLQYWKQFIQTKATVTEKGNRFNRPQPGIVIIVNGQRHSTNWSANLSLCVRFNSQSIYIITKAGHKWDHHIWLSYCIRNDLDPPLTLLILWHFRDLLGTFMIYAQFMKGVSSNFGG